MQTERAPGNRVVFWTLATLVVVSWPASGRAQEETQETATAPGWFVVSEVQVKPEMRQEWLDLQRREVNPALKKAGVPMRGVWENVIGDLATYVSVTPLEKLAALEEPGPLRRGLSPEARIVLLQKLSKCISGRHRSVVKVRPDLSITKQLGAERQFAVVILLSIVPGQQMRFERLMKSEVLPALEKGGVDAFLAHQTAFGGDGNEWVFVSLIRSLAEIDKGPPLVRALGEEGARTLAAKWTGLIASSSLTIARRSRALSFE